MKESAPRPLGVTAGDLFEEVRLCAKGLAANLDVHAEVRPTSKGGSKNLAHLKRSGWHFLPIAFGDKGRDFVGMF